jgi:DnaJ-class molecular chaperone
MSLRIRDLGLPISDSGRRGDLYIKLLLKLPELSKTEIRKLKNLVVFNPNKNESQSSLNEQENTINIVLNDF